MGVIFESNIKIDEAGDWYIELRDTSDDRMEICKDLNIYSNKLEEFSREYDGNIEEVKWIKDENVPSNVMNEIRAEMASYRAEIEAQSEESLVEKA